MTPVFLRVSVPLMRVRVSPVSGVRVRVAWLRMVLVFVPVLIVQLLVAFRPFVPLVPAGPFGPVLPVGPLGPCAPGAPGVPLRFMNAFHVVGVVLL